MPLDALAELPPRAPAASRSRTEELDCRRERAAESPARPPPTMTAVLDVRWEGVGILGLVSWRRAWRIMSSPSPLARASEIHLSRGLVSRGEEGGRRSRRRKIRRRGGRGAVMVDGLPGQLATKTQNVFLRHQDLLS
jgi:hypothetical protein